MTHSITPLCPHSSWEKLCAESPVGVPGTQDPCTHGKGHGERRLLGPLVTLSLGVCPRAEVLEPREQTGASVLAEKWLSPWEGFGSILHFLLTALDTLYCNCFFFFPSQLLNYPYSPVNCEPYEVRHYVILFHQYLSIDKVHSAVHAICAC